MGKKNIYSYLPLLKVCKVLWNVEKNNIQCLNVLLDVERFYSWSP